MHRSSPFEIPRRPSLRIAAFTLALGAGLTCYSAPARAEVSSWAAVAYGPTWLDEGGTGSAPSLGFDMVHSVTMQTGIGSSPAAPFIFGGLAHLQANFGRGTDLGLLARLATQGFVLGNWGGALDLGPYARFWGLESQGALASVIFGAPWGIMLSANGGLGTHGAKEFGVTLGIDFARLTVYRTSGENWFPNPYPAYRAQK